MSSIRRTHLSSSRLGVYVHEAIPAWIPPIVRKFWEFTKKNSKEFAKHLNDPQKREEELIKAVSRSFKT